MWTVLVSTLLGVAPAGEPRQSVLLAMEEAQLDPGLELKAASFAGLPSPAPGIQFSAEILRHTASALGARVCAAAPQRALGCREYELGLERRAELVVPLVDLEKDMIVTAADVALVRRPLPPGGERYAQALEAVVGRVATRRLLADRPVAARYLARPPVVRRGEVVHVTVEMGGLVVSMLGEAQSEGAVGELVFVYNRAAGRTVHARVLGPGRAQVPLAVGPVSAWSTAEKVSAR